MFETLGLDSLILGSSICVGLIGLGAASYMSFRSRESVPVPDVSKSVKSAPYHRLHNILPIER
jgi:hypothetical protein